MGLPLCRQEREWKRQGVELSRQTMSNWLLKATEDWLEPVYELPVVRQLTRLDELSFTKPVTFLIGENGTGKSTLLEAIAVASGFNAEGGTRNFTFSTASTHSDLYRHLTISKRVHQRMVSFARGKLL